MTQIIFRKPAFEEMDRIFRAHPERAGEFATVLRQINEALTTHADEVGESREPPYRVAFFGHFTIRFRPAPEEKRVYVVHVRLRRG
jgi:hypothetical protein